VFPFAAELRRVLEEQHKVAERLQKTGVITPCVFIYTVGKKTGQRITESGFNKAWRKARIVAGCPGRIPHDFRRTAVRNLVRAGAGPVQFAQEIHHGFAAARVEVAGGLLPLVELADQCRKEHPQEQRVHHGGRVYTTARASRPRRRSAEL
jgi:hypothetical protein